MMLWQALALGVIQGLTEFLPVSSSGHLVFFQTLFGMKEPMLAFDIAVHGGTLLAIVVYFHKEVRDLFLDFGGSLQRLFSGKAERAKALEGTSPLSSPRRLWVCILISLVPTAVLAILFNDLVKAAFSNLVLVAAAWFVMGILLIASQWFPKRQKDLAAVRYKDSLWIGLAQGIAIIPGISRSGSTILAGMMRGFRQEAAAKFSFLMAIPAILAALFLDLKGGADFFTAHPVAMIAGFLTAAFTGYLVVKWLMHLVRKGKFFVFGYYSIFMSFLALACVVFHWVP